MVQRFRVPGGSKYIPQNQVDGTMVIMVTLVQVLRKWILVLGTMVIMVTLVLVLGKWMLVEYLDSRQLKYYA